VIGEDGEFDRASPGGWFEDSRYVFITAVPSFVLLEMFFKSKIRLTRGWLLTKWQDPCGLRRRQLSKENNHIRRYVQVLHENSYLVESVMPCRCPVRIPTQRKRTDKNCHLALSGVEPTYQSVGLLHGLHSEREAYSMYQHPSIRLYKVRLSSSYRRP
jgi:hypothetical protein